MENRMYKDRLFNFLFGSEENKAWTLSLYNAVNKSAYTDPSAIEITTIREVMYLGMHNDISFLILETMNLYEQQSTYNPNMPVRFLEYAGNLYDKYMKQRRLNKYGGALLSLPAPRFVVFYNGTAEQPDEKLLRLSDSFPDAEEYDIEVKVRMLNVNYGRNRALLEACKPLDEYAWLVAEIRGEKARNKGESIDSAVDRAISAMPDDYLIKPFLQAHRAEVRGMLLTEYDEAETMELFKDEGRREGRREGLKEGILLTLASLVRKGLLSPGDAARQAGMSEEAFREALRQTP